MYSSAHIWSSSRLVAHGFLDEMEDGIHVGKMSLDWDTQILLNLYCNSNLDFNDGTCCKAAESVTLMQLIVLAVLVTRLNSCLLF
jgi:N-acetylneuraminate 9-O-acetyltransferase